jgi:filamentous hemagglutinin
MQVGAGGNWPTIDEVVDPKVVKQQDDLSCGAACGQMLLQDRGINVDQSTVARETGGVPVSPASLKSGLTALDPEGTHTWVGGTIPGETGAQTIQSLSRKGSWAAILWDGPNARMGHMVVVDGMDNADRVLIRDPWNGTSYKMRLRDFLDVWTDIAIFRQ